MSEPSEHILYLQSYQSPCGLLTLGQTFDHICLCVWSDTTACRIIMERTLRWFDRKTLEQSTSLLTTAKEQLDEYFKGTRTKFTIPLLMPGTKFQWRTWKALQEIPYGQTVSYSAIAQRLKVNIPVREIARVIASNPLNIFIPCHRVIGKNQSLTGYAGGLQAKQYLLELEGNMLPLSLAENCP